MADILAFLKKPIKSVLSGKTAGKPDVSGLLKKKPAEGYYATTTSRGYSFGPSPEHDPYSDRPYLDFRNPGDTSTTTDKTRVASRNNPLSPAPSVRDDFYNERMPESASSAIRKELKARGDEELDHGVALALSGSNARENLSLLDKEKNQAFGMLERALQKQVLEGKISLFQAQIKDAKAKGKPLPFVASPQPKYEQEADKANKDAKAANSVRGLLKETIKGIPSTAKRLVSPEKAGAEALPKKTEGFKVDTDPFSIAPNALKGATGNSTASQVAPNATEVKMPFKQEKVKSVLGEVSPVLGVAEKIVSEFPERIAQTVADIYNQVIHGNVKDKAVFQKGTEKVSTAFNEATDIQALAEKNGWSIPHATAIATLYGVSTIVADLAPFVSLGSKAALTATKYNKAFDDALFRLGLDKGPFTVDRWAKNTQKALDNIVKTGDEQGFAQLVRDYKTIGDTLSSGKSVKLNPAGKFLQQVSKKIEEPVLGRGGQFNIATADDALPGYRRRPGQAPAFGMSTEEIQPVGFGGNKPSGDIQKVKFPKEVTNITTIQKALSTAGYSSGEIRGVIINLSKGGNETNIKTEDVMKELRTLEPESPLDFLQKPISKITPETPSAPSITEYLQKPISKVVGPSKSPATSPLDFLKKPVNNVVLPKTPEEAKQIYYDQVIAPAQKAGEATVIGADDLKDHFNGDYNDVNHPIYSRAAYLLYEQALKENPGDLLLTGGGAGSGKTELLVNNFKGRGFKGIIYDSNMSNFDGAVKQIEAARKAGKDIKISGVLPNLDKARSFTILRENEKGRGISDKTFARGHAGFPAVVDRLLKEGYVKPEEVDLFDFRNITNLEEARKMVTLNVRQQDPIAFLKKIGYNEDNVRSQYSKILYDQASGRRLSDPSVRESVNPPLSKDRANLERRDEPGGARQVGGRELGEGKEQPKGSNTARVTAHITEEELDKIAAKIKARDFTDADVEEVRTRIAIAAEALEANPAKNLAKYANKRGELGEVTGKGTSYWSRHGDEIAADLGFDSTEDAREAFEIYKEQKANLNELRKDFKVMRDEQIAVRKGEILMQKARGDRRTRLRVLKDRYDLTDNDLTKIRQGKDIISMTEDEFAEFIAESELHAEDLQKIKEARIQLEGTIEAKQLKKVENLQKALDLPKIDQMTESQLREFDSILSQYQFGDEFLGQRKLETIDRTAIAGVKTYREAATKLAEVLSKRFNREIKPDELTKIVGSMDRMKWDTTLAEKNPFYRLMVEDVNATLLGAETNIIDIQERINELMARVHKGSIGQKLVPRDNKIIQYLESPDKAQAATALNEEEFAAATYINKYFQDALDYLYAQKALRHSRFEDVYYPHMRRGLLEALVTTKGGPWAKLKEGIQTLLEKQKLEKAIIDILDQKTGQILPMDKYFKYVQTREGNLVPSQNLTKVFLEYAKMLETKKALDSIIPEIMTYVDVLTPRKFTRTGLEMDDKLKTFVTEYINNKKGRRATLLFPQGSKPDNVLRTLAAFLSFRDLGLNLPVQIGSNPGVIGGVYTLLGPGKFAKGLYRYRATIVPEKFASEEVKKIKDILKQARAYTGVNPWKELADISKDVGSKIFSSMFVLFRDAVVRSNQIHLLGSLTDEEWRTGQISKEHMAQLKIEAGKWLPVERSESIYGSTVVGKAATKYKTWAIVPAHRALKNFATVGNLLGKGKFEDVYNSRALRENLNAGVYSAFVALIAFAAAKAEEKRREKRPESFLTKLEDKLIQDGLSFITALNPTTLLSQPRLYSFVSDLGLALSELIKMEKYQKSGKGYEEGDLKGVNKLQSTLKPTIINTIQKALDGFSNIDTAFKPEKITNLPKLPKLKKRVTPQKIRALPSDLKAKLPKLTKKTNN